MKKPVAIILTFLFTITIKAQVEPLLVYKVAQQKSCQEWVEKTFSRMSPKERIGQLFIHTVTPVMSKENKKMIRDAVRVSKIGGVLFSGGELQEQAQLTNYAQSQADIPLMITFDGEWGIAMRLKKTPKFPRNGVLGAIQKDQLIFRYGKESEGEQKGRGEGATGRRGERAMGRRGDGKEI